MEISSVPTGPCQASMSLHAIMLAPPSALGVQLDCLTQRYHSLEEA